MLLLVNTGNQCLIGYLIILVLPCYHSAINIPNCTSNPTGFIT